MGGTFNDPNAHNAPEPVKGTNTSFTGSLTSFTLLAANSARKGATFYNDDASRGVWYLSLGSSPATSSSFTVEVRAKWYYEVPFDFCGAIQGVSSVAGATSNIRVTEVI